MLDPEPPNCGRPYATPINPLRHARWRAGSAAIDGKGYIYGGNGHQSTLRYTPPTDCWAIGKPMPTLRAGIASTELNGEAYAIAGLKRPSPPGPLAPDLRTNESYVPATDVWKEREPIPVGRDGRRYAPASTLNNRLFIYGGVQRGENYINYVDSYEPAEEAWSEHAAMPAPGRSANAAATVEDRGYVFGGVRRHVQPEQVFMRDTDEYDPIADTWRGRRLTPPYGREDCAATTI